jgi:hypothetical protein
MAASASPAPKAQLERLALLALSALRVPLAWAFL